MVKETEAKGGNREHVYFKVLLKNIIHTIKFLFKKYISIHIYLFKYRQLFMVIQSIHSSRSAFPEIYLITYLALTTLAPKKLFSFNYTIVLFL